MSPKYTLTTEARTPRGMVRDRLAIIRKCFEAWTSDRFELLAHHLDPAVEVDWSDSLAPYRGVYSGYAGLVELFREMRAPFAEVCSELHDFLVAGQHVVVSHTDHMRGRDGVEVIARSTLVFTFLGLKLVCLRLFQCESDALAAIRGTS